MKPLDRILQNLMKRSSEIGKIYTGEKLVEMVPGNANTKIASVAVPAGTYIITANMQWEESQNAFTASVIMKNASTIATQRGNMEGGGGDSLSVITTFNTNGEISVRTVHTHTAPVGISADLKAIRIK